MAESENNIVTHGLSGKVGNTLVFRQRAGKTVVASPPHHTNKPVSNPQVLQRQKFQEAVIYGKIAIKDIATKAAYEAAAASGISAFNIAVADMLNAPDIELIDLSAYHGNIGDKITVKATDDFKVTGVTVGIYKTDGTLIEKGSAIAGTNGLLWVYNATVANSASITGDKIVVDVTDTPGNVTEKQQIVV